MGLYDKPLERSTIRAMSDAERRLALATVFDGTTWYIYNALRYRLDAIRKCVEDSQRVLDTEKDVLPIMRASMDGQMDYLKQLIRELELIDAQLAPFFWADR